MTPKSVARGILFAIGSFLVLGTVAALWPNPFFMRMTPTSGFERNFCCFQIAHFANQNNFRSLAQGGA